MLPIWITNSGLFNGGRTWTLPERSICDPLEAETGTVYTSKREKIEKKEVKVKATGAGFMADTCDWDQAGRGTDLCAGGITQSLLIDMSKGWSRRISRAGHIVFPSDGAAGGGDVYKRTGATECDEVKSRTMCASRGHLDLSLVAVKRPHARSSPVVGHSRRGDRR